MTATAATAQRSHAKTSYSSSQKRRMVSRAALKPQNTLRGNPQNIDMRRRTTQRLDYSKAEIFQHRAPSRDPTKVLASASSAQESVIKNVNKAAGQSRKKATKVASTSDINTCSTYIVKGKDTQKGATGSKDTTGSKDNTGSKDTAGSKDKKGATTSNVNTSLNSSIIDPKPSRANKRAREEKNIVSAIKKNKE